eukprot:4150117-Pyramimonas_sp.AAC.1
MRSSVDAQSGLRLLFATKLSMGAIFLTGSCEKYHPLMNLMDGLSFRSVGHLKDMSIIMASAWGLRARSSRTATGHARP